MNQLPSPATSHVIYLLAGLLALTTVSAAPRGGNLLANVGPKGDGGTISPKHSDLSWEFGEQQ